MTRRETGQSDAVVDGLLGQVFHPLRSQEPHPASWQHLAARLGRTSKGKTMTTLRLRAVPQQGTAPLPGLTAGGLRLLVHLYGRDPVLWRHSRQVAGRATWIGRELGLTRRMCSDLQIAGLLHDYGKLGLSAAILAQAGPLSVADRAIIQTHPVRGALRVAADPALAHLAAWIRGHHERWDGEGYPDGLYGSAIPLGARILAVADTWAAMSTDRPYQPRRGRAAIRAELGRQAGWQFDPQVVAVARRLF